MKRLMVPLALVSTAALVLSGCAGAAGGAGSDSGGGDGFAHGAAQEEVDAVLADLEPVTLKYQPAASSPNSIMAPATHAYKAYIEERSGGKITLDVIWGQAVAGYDEI